MEIDYAAEEEGVTARVEKPPKFPKDEIVISASELETFIGKRVSREFEKRYGMPFFFEKKQPS